MDVPTPSHAVIAFASFVRERLAEVSATLSPLWSRGNSVEVLLAGHHEAGESTGAAHHPAMLIVGATPPFAATSHARARLLRQAHASGLLGAGETEQGVQALALRSGSRPAGPSECEVSGASG